MSDPSDNRKRQRDDFARALSFFSQIGFTITACVLIGVFLGRYLDGLFGTSPTLLLICSLLGAAAAIKTLLDMARKK